MIKFNVDVFNVCLVKLTPIFFLNNPFDLQNVESPAVNKLGNNMDK